MYGNGHHISNVSPLLQMWTERPVDGFGQGSNAPQLNPNGYQSTHMPSDPRRPAPSDPRSQQYRSWPPVSERQAPPAVAQHATLNSSQYTQKSQSNIEDEDDVPPLPPVSDTMANSASAPNIPSVNSKSERPGKGGISPADLHTLAELSEDGRILKTVHELQEEQVRKENELLAKRTAIIEKHENDLLALEITGTLSPQQKRENKQLLAEELRIYDKMILKEMDFVRKNQQAGVPLFNVTNDPRAIIRQQNVLSLLTSMMPT
ncbi:hypothetical protein DFJ77DRAFT_103102 [Powellomyces hirtus]|nr:hypothetical protein DFJ77DRAFT_103102 [Powellomyces hirtus]